MTGTMGIAVKIEMESREIWRINSIRTGHGYGVGGGLATWLLLKQVDKFVLLFTERNSERVWNLKEQVVSSLLDLLSIGVLQSSQRMVSRQLLCG